jgi:hypothetical protein
MRFAFGILLSFTAVGCAHVDRERALATTAWDVMTDAEIAHAAVAEALGELHQVEAIDADGLVVKGTSSFGSREERLTYERRVDAIVRAQVYGQGPTLELVHVRCEQLQRAGWAGWPGDERLRRSACEYGELTVHSLYKKPMLQRALVDLMLTAANDPLLAGCCSSSARASSRTCSSCRSGNVSKASARAPRRRRRSSPEPSEQGGTFTPT